MIPHSPPALALSAAQPAGAGSQLVHGIEEMARRAQIADLYLLTTSAEESFRQRGYRRADRANAPAAIGSTEEFRTLCPASAILMTRSLRP